MDIFSILQLFGGVGLFLFGMSLMGSSLEKLAGSGLERILERLTTAKTKAAGHVKGFSLGLGVTGIIQSSAATTIMLIGFVNAGIMRLAQAIPVVFGSNVGSTVTAQILRLGDLGSGNIVLQLLKPSSFAPALVAIGSVMHMFCKKVNTKQVAGILAGLGILFYGMTTMEEVFMPLRESPAFRRFFTSFENPLIGILTGLVITAIIQSSSASVGILQALSATGSVTWAIAIPIIIGQNLGKCMTIILGSIGANKKAKRVSLSYLIFNIFGAIAFASVIYLVHYFVGIDSFSKVVNRGDIANFHFAFNFITAMVLLPFSEGMAKLTGKIIKDQESETTDKFFAALDDMLLHTPTVALSQCRRLILELQKRMKDSFKIATGMINNYSEEGFATLLENESFADKCETALSSYIIRINRKRLSVNDSRVMSEILNSVSDYERIGDYIMNIAYISKEKNENGSSFSPVGQMEIETITNATSHALDVLFMAFENDDASLSTRVEPLAETIDKMKEMIKAHHVERLQDGTCAIASGVFLFDLTNCFERIASHASNIALHVIKRVSGADDFDEMHGHAGDQTSIEYRALYQYYEGQYIEPITHPVIPIPADQTSSELSDDPSLKKAEKSKKAVSDKTMKSGEKAEKAEKKNKQTEKAKAEKPKTDKKKAEKEVKAEKQPKPETKEKEKEKQKKKKK